ncbi:E3 ubiquitin/ISG15 ligase TRIM25-like isoform X2 [Misgurnus anguillicaudatus]|uniref:E3 ubiquitin/ISG15 ligase TRIM25-like isoform X2 n=1 Tax=Misgurnus anguillicaudatus TaxID=75329 RepID=UPI003CCEFB9E
MTDTPVYTPFINTTRKYLSSGKLKLLGYCVFRLSVSTYGEMAEASISVVQDQFICSICLDLLKDPVTIPCGHSYCMSCITDCWDQDDQKRDYSCPQCRQTFTTRPVLGKNTMLAEVVEKLKKTKLQAARPDHCYAESGDVECDVCTERKHKAVKSCLVCLNSYCQTHFKLHEELHSGKRHKVTDATGRLQQMICPQHEKLLEIYCKTDQLCICLLCIVGKHKNHDTIPAKEERTEKQSFQSLSVPPGSSDSLSITVSSLISFDDVGKSVSHLREKLEDFCREEIEKIFDKSKAPKPETREQFLKYYHHFTADPNTAYKRLCLSEGNRVITYTFTLQPYPDHPDRFDHYAQVLCSESVSGCCYWEVELSGEVNISVSYKSIKRKGGRECVFGRNDQSWSLCCPVSSCSFRHNNIETKLPVVSRSSRIGVYVDHSAGSLSFYSVSDTMTLIHRVNTTFTKPLYPGFNVYGSVKLCDITI